jgi:hypothetical protein
MTVEFFLRSCILTMRSQRRRVRRTVSKRRKMTFRRKQKTRSARRRRRSSRSRKMRGGLRSAERGKKPLQSLYGEPQQRIRAEVRQCQEVVCDREKCMDINKRVDDARSTLNDPTIPKICPDLANKGLIHDDQALPSGGNLLGWEAPEWKVGALSGTPAVATKAEREIPATLFTSPYEKQPETTPVSGAVSPGDEPSLTLVPTGTAEESSIGDVPSSPRHTTAPVPQSFNP